LNPQATRLPLQPIFFPLFASHVDTARPEITLALLPNDAVPRHLNHGHEEKIHHSKKEAADENKIVIGARGG
jgi:hypothetical protein